MNTHFALSSSVDWQRVVVTGGFLMITLVAAILFYLALFFMLSRLARITTTPLAALLVQRLRSPARLLFPLLSLLLVIPLLEIPTGGRAVVQHLLTLCIIAGITWTIINATCAIRDHILSHYGIEMKDDLKARTVKSHLTVAFKVVQVVVLVVALSGMLMTFAKIRTIGMSMLASAGIIGITLGFAAQRSIATLFAGLQIAITQPIRVKDVVLVEGEYGTIEEISLTYVVVKVWDLRRLIVPVTYFLEKPFQNWTRDAANLVGTVFLYADYTLPVEQVRQKLHEILLDSDAWDHKEWGLQVTNTSDRALELRALMSAVDSPTVWDLRCEVREKLLAFMQETYPECLPWSREGIAVAAENKASGVHENSVDNGTETSMQK